MRLGGPQPALGRHGLVDGTPKQGCCVRDPHQGAWGFEQRRRPWQHPRRQPAQRMCAKAEAGASEAARMWQVSAYLALGRDWQVRC